MTVNYGIILLTTHGLGETDSKIPNLPKPGQIFTLVAYKTDLFIFCYLRLFYGVHFFLLLSPDVRPIRPCGFLGGQRSERIENTLKAKVGSVIILVRVGCLIKLIKSIPLSDELISVAPGEKSALTVGRLGKNGRITDARKSGGKYGVCQVLRM